jgi:hypothetical protein
VERAFAMAALCQPAADQKCEHIRGSANIAVKQGFSSAQAAVDAVTLTLFLKNDSALRMLPSASSVPAIDLAAS